MGFDYYAYSGLETGSRDVVTHVVRNKSGVMIAFSSPYTKDLEEMNDHIKVHGDGVRDVAFAVEDATAIYNKSVSRGAKSVFPPKTLQDENGSVIVAAVHTYGDTIHTFI